jgi:hypothetical protein
VKAWAIVIITALVIAGLGGFLIKQYGKARYDAGYSKARIDQAVAQLEAEAKARKDFDNVSHETNGLDDAAVDLQLRALGIVRQPEDR